MDIVIACAAFLLVSLSCAVFLYSLPTVMISVGVWIVRIGRDQKRRQDSAAQRVEERMMRELQREA